MPSLGAGSPPILHVHDVTVAYQRKPVLWNVDLMIREPRLVGVVGPNGAGKSTLLKAILGLIPLASGRVEIGGKPLAKQRRLVGYVPQRESVDWEFPVTVLDTVLMGTYGRVGWVRRPGKVEREWARHCLAQVELSEFADRQIGQLSGGQQQRVFLARALAQKAQIYFMDEPLASVDAATATTIFRVLKELRAQGCTLLVVHHDLRSVRDYFEDVLLLNMRLVAHGPVETTLNAENLRRAYGARLDALESAGAAVRERNPV
ncbi:MAG TPA: metal ABC transporter ATP-binding protein [Planctomycetia bacterium]|nr:metal ABC transporter ATP-binding protein [Planctomycetia bacterium]